MEGIISGLKRMEIHDGDGIRTTVFFKGCPLRCLWCHNPETFSKKSQIAHFSEKCVSCGSCNGACEYGAVNLGKIDHNKCVYCLDCVKICPVDALTAFGTTYDEKTLADILAKDKPFFEKSGGGVTMSGGECLFQPDFAVALAKELKSRGISVYVDTSGFTSREVLESIIPYTDKFLYDIKAIDDEVHKTCTGQDNKVILDNLKFLISNGISVEIRYPLVVGYNDAECEKIGQWLKNNAFRGKVKVLQYHSMASSRYEALGMKSTLPNTKTTPDDVKNAVEILKSFGIDTINGITDN